MTLARAARRGALLGLAGAAAFFLLHAFIVQPIWTRFDAMLRALALAPTMGALFAIAHERARGAAAFAHPLGGMLVGALAGVALVPFVVAGLARAHQAPTPFWMLLLALLLAGASFATSAFAAPGRGAELFATILLANAFPSYFLTFIADFHEEMPDPIPMTLALVAIYVACGAGLRRHATV